MIKFIQNKYIIFVLFALVSDAYMSKITPSVDVSQISNWKQKKLKGYLQQTPA